MRSKAIGETYCFVWNNRTIYPENLDYNSTKCHVTAGLYPDELFKSEDSPDQYICSRYNEFFPFILKYLHCSLDFRSTNAQFGGRLVNGSWNGILELFDKKTADFIPAFFAAVNHRERIIHYDFVVPQKSLVTLLSFPKYRENPWSLFSSFSQEIWFLIVLFFLLYGAVQWFSLSHEKHQRKSAFHLISNYLHLMAVFLGQGNVKLSTRVSRLSIFRNPILFWLFAAFILRQIFSSNVTAIILSRSRFVFDTFDQLLRHKTKLKIIIEGTSSAQSIFDQLFPSLIPQTETVNHQDISSIETLRKLIYANYVLTIPREFAEQIQKAYPSVGFYNSREGFALALGSSAIRKSLDVKIKRKLTKIIKRLYYSGIDSHVRQWMPINVYSALKNTNSLSISLESVKASTNLLDHSHSDASDDLESRRKTILSFFYIFLIGIACSCTAFVLELFIYCFKIKKSSSNKKHLYI